MQINFNLGSTYSSSFLGSFPTKTQIDSSVCLCFLLIIEQGQGDLVNCVWNFSVHISRLFRKIIGMLLSCSHIILKLKMDVAVVYFGKWFNCALQQLLVTNHSDFCVRNFELFFSAVIGLCAVIGLDRGQLPLDISTVIGKRPSPFQVSFYHGFSKTVFRIHFQTLSLISFLLSTPCEQSIDGKGRDLERDTLT